MIKIDGRRRFGACVAVFATLGLGACGQSDGKPVGEPTAQTVTVVGLPSAQSKVLTDIYARALENKGFRVARRAAVADLAAGYAALQSGAADLFITHTGELLTFLAANEPAAASTSTTTVATTTTVVPTTTTIALADSTTTTVSTAGQASAVSLNLQSNLIGEILPAALQIGAVSNAEDKPVIACNAATATGISLLSELAQRSASLRIAGTAEFRTGDPFGLVGFERTYGATFGEFVPVAATEIGNAFAPAPTVVADSSTTTSSGATPATQTTAATATVTAADCGAFASNLDTAISSEMVVFDDDKNWVGNNGVIPLLTATGYSPGVAQVVDQVSQALRTADLREGIRQVDAGGSAATFAGQWLQAAGVGGG